MVISAIITTSAATITASAPNLAGLPETKYLIYGAAAGDPQVTTKLVDDFMAPINKELAALGDEGKPLLSYIDALKQYTSSYNSMTFGMVAPAAGEPLVQMVGINTGDSKGMIEAQKSSPSVRVSGG